MPFKIFLFGNCVIQLSILSLSSLNTTTGNPKIMTLKTLGIVQKAIKDDLTQKLI